jgi:hypothetical protein
LSLGEQSSPHIYFNDKGVVCCVSNLNLNLNLNLKWEVGFMLFAIYDLVCTVLYSIVGVRWLIMILMAV